VRQGVQVERRGIGLRQAETEHEDLQYGFHRLRFDAGSTLQTSSRCSRQGMVLPGLRRPAAEILL
jgi:hypothetical protein